MHTPISFLFPIREQKMLHRWCLGSIFNLTKQVLVHERWFISAHICSHKRTAPQRQSQKLLDLNKSLTKKGKQFVWIGLIMSSLLSVQKLLSAAKGWKITASKGGTVTMVNDPLFLLVFYLPNTPCALTWDDVHAYTQCCLETAANISASWLTRLDRWLQTFAREMCSHRVHSSYSICIFNQPLSANINHNNGH